MPQLELAAGTIEYQDTGGDGPVLVFLHGLTMDGSLWRKVVPGLVPDYRCVLPTLPLGGHRRPMRPGADLSLRGLGLLVGEFVERAGLTGVTLVQNDWGGAQILVAEGDTARVARLVISSCEAFGNYPPRPARAMVLAARIPGGLAAMMWLLRLRAVRRAPGSWGWMSKRPVPDEVMDAWFRPAATSPAIRRDLARYLTSVPSRPVLLEWAGRSATFERPVLVVWATEDRMMPRRHGRRLADLFPDARLIEIDDSYTLLPEDQPEQLVRAIRDFVPAARRSTPLLNNAPIRPAPRADRGR
jgi:pimeloyl-ACP methyl ester carboxylesterase